MSENFYGETLYNGFYDTVNYQVGKYAYDNNNATQHKGLNPKEASLNNTYYCGDYNDEGQKIIAAINSLKEERMKLLQILYDVNEIRRDINTKIAPNLKDATGNFGKFMKNVYNENENCIFSDKNGYTKKGKDWYRRLNEIDEKLWDEISRSSGAINGDMINKRYDFESDSYSKFQGVSDLAGIINRYLETSIVVRINACQSKISELDEKLKGYKLQSEN